MQSQALIEELRWRGMLYQHTEGLPAAVDAGPITGYIGFDPTSSSLHVGHLVPIMSLVHLQRHGHTPVALIGGGTGMIGDPSGRASERALLTPDVVEQNVKGIRAQLERFLDFEGAQAARLRNNGQWLGELGAIEFLRDVGKHFTVNVMLQKESVKARLEGGISFTEFAYMLLQAYDYLELFRRDGTTLQLGGSDQWGNITAGIDLIRRVAGAEAHALTLPLVTTSSGTKFGKTEAGSVWLDAARTSPYKFFQFWINVDDRDAGRYLGYFTLLSRQEIEALQLATTERPASREAQRALARDVTARVHGNDAMRAAAEASEVVFGGVSAHHISLAALQALAAEIPCFVSSSLETQAILAAATRDADALFKSKGDARRVMQQGGVYINDVRLDPDVSSVPAAHLLHGEYLLLSKGNRQRALVRIDPSALATAG